MNTISAISTSRNEQYLGAYSLQARALETADSGHTKLLALASFRDVFWKSSFFDVFEDTIFGYRLIVA
jgi:hypothetical protein